MDVTSVKGSTGKEQVIKSACGHHCGACCIWKVHVKDDVITRLEPDDESVEPQLRGCLRGHALRQQVYAHDRLKYPLKRTGPRGSGQFERISWDEALETTASELMRIKETYGNSAILFGGGAGNCTTVHGGKRGMSRLLNMIGGYTDHWCSPSWEAALFASAATYGTISNANTRDDLLNSRLIILWGVHPASTIHSTNTMWYLAQAKETGAKIISIDPRYTSTAAALAEQWIPIIPSSDTAMAIAMAYVMITENLQDQAFLDRYTVGFDKFKDYVLGIADGIAKTPEWAEQHTGVPAATIEQVARDYATIKPGALISGISAGRTAFGEQFHRATATLAAMTGNVGVHGGEAAGRSLGDQVPFNPYPFNLGPEMPTGKNPVDEEAPQRHTYLSSYILNWWPLGGEPRNKSFARVHQIKQADAVLKGRAGGYHADYKAVIAHCSNPVNQMPTTKKWHEGLNNVEFMLSFEQFMTATARYADIVLPTTTVFERNDLIVGGAKPFYGFLKKVIEPMYECKDPLEICNLLAIRMGIDAKIFNDKTDEEWVKQIAMGGGDVPDWEAFKESAIYRIPLTEPYVSFKKQIEDPENNPFLTPSGKIEIYSQPMADMNDPLLPPIPTYFEPWEGRHSPLAKTYPLQLITVRSQRRAHTQFDTLPWLREIIPNNAELNPVDAEARDVKDGDMLKIYNDRGEIRITATVTERIMPGVVNVPQGAWFKPDEKGIDRGGCPNTLCSDDYSPCGSYTWGTNLVEVEKARD
ncbi:molybdopterin-dependent oxidoreductase [Chloroflexota bacterium]